MFDKQIKRYTVMRNFIALAVHVIIEHCLELQIGNLVLGDLEGMNRRLRVRKKTSQLFQQIPYTKFKENLKQEAEL